MKRKPKRRPDGRWQRKRCGRLFLSSISQEDADRQAEEYAASIKLGMQRTADKMTVLEYTNKWLPINKADVSDDYYNDCARMVRILCDYVGDKVIRDVVPDDLQRIFSEFYIDKSAQYIRQASSLYKHIFQSAVDSRYCLTNPMEAKSIHLPKGTSGSHRALEDWELDIIHKYGKKDKLYPIVMLLLYTGMRPGEAVAIDIDKDIDFVNKTVTVRRARHENNRVVTVTETGKTENATGRVIPLFSPLEEVLKGKHGPIITDKFGRVDSETTWYWQFKSFLYTIECGMNGTVKQWFHRKKGDPLREKLMEMEKAGKHEEAEALRLADWKTFDIRPYDFRHTFATWCRDNDVDINVLLKWMGHADSAMVRKIYDHVRDKRVEKEVEKLENSLKSSGNGSNSNLNE